MGLGSMGGGGFKNAVNRSTTDGITTETMRGQVIACLPLEYDDTALYVPRSGGQKPSKWSQLFAEVLIVTGEDAGTHEDKVSIRGNLADQLAAQVPDGGFGKTKLLVRVVAGADVTGDDSVRWFGIEPLTDEEFDEAEKFVTEFFAPKRTTSSNGAGSGKAKAGSSSSSRSTRRGSDDPPF